MNMHELNKRMGRFIKKIANNIFFEASILAVLAVSGVALSMSIFFLSLTPIIVFLGLGAWPNGWYEIRSVFFKGLLIMPWPFFLSLYLKHLAKLIPRLSEESAKAAEALIIDHPEVKPRLKPLIDKAIQSDEGTVLYEEVQKYKRLFCLKKATEELLGKTYKLQKELYLS